MDKQVVAPDEFTRHLMFYAKEHYKKTKLIEDLRTISAKMIAVKREKISIGIIYEYVVKAYCEIASIYKSPLYGLQETLTSLFFRNFHIKKPGKLSIEEAIAFLIGKLDVPVLNNQGERIIEIGKPDYTILPEPKKQNLRRRNNERNKKKKS